MRQERICHFDILTLVDQSYDQTVQAKTCLEMLGIISGQGNLVATNAGMEYVAG